MAPGILAAIGLGGLLSYEAEWISTAVAVVIGLVAGAQGYRKHGSRGILAGFVVMSLALLAVRFLDVWVGGEYGTAQRGEHLMPIFLAILAGIGMVSMHWFNMRGTPHPGSGDAS
jgi:hypothetical protein